MKKLLVLMLAVAMVFLLASCQPEESNELTKKDQKDIQTLKNIMDDCATSLFSKYWRVEGEQNYNIEEIWDDELRARFYYCDPIDLLTKEKDLLLSSPVLITSMQKRSLIQHQHTHSLLLENWKRVLTG